MPLSSSLAKPRERERSNVTCLLTLSSHEIVVANELKARASRKLLSSVSPDVSEVDVYKEGERERKKRERNREGRRERERD